MGKSIALMIVTMGLLSGCAGEVWYVDSRFSAEERDQIQAAADSWEAIGAKPQDFIWRAKVSEFEDGRNVITRTGARAAEQVWDGFRDPAYLGVTLARPLNTRIILVLERMAQGELQMQAAHEFGHAYGLHHAESRRALMFPCPEVQGPTELDAHALMLAGQP